jgi:hypothetical protein
MASSSSSSNNNNASASTSANTEAPLQEWFVIAPDFDGALEKRLKVRPDHIGGLKADREDFWLWGGTSSRFSLPACLFWTNARRCHARGADPGGLDGAA